MPLTPETKPKYQVRIDEVGRYDWTGLVVDMTGERPDATTIQAKSLGELLTKITVALMLRDKQIGTAAPDGLHAPGNGAPVAPIVLTPSRRIQPPPA